MENVFFQNSPENAAENLSRVEKEIKNVKRGNNWPRDFFIVFEQILIHARPNDVFSYVADTP